MVPRTLPQRALAVMLFVILMFAAGYSGLFATKARQARKAEFRRTQLDGGELASLLKLRCGKYTYSGPETWFFWRLMAKRFGPNDELIEEVELGGGGSGLRSGDSFRYLIPIHEAGTVEIHFNGLGVSQDISPLLPAPFRSWSSSSQVPFDTEHPMLLEVFAVDAERQLTSPPKLPPGLGGHAVAITLEVIESEPGAENPFYSK